MDFTYYVALPFAIAGSGVKCVPERQCGGHARGGALVQARLRRRDRVLPNWDPATGEFSDAKLIRKFGDVPDDLSAL